MMWFKSPTMLRASGFFTAVLGPVGAYHLVRQPLPSELLDAGITSLGFTLFFLLGDLAGARSGDIAGKPFRIGASAGLIHQSPIWRSWLRVPDGLRGTISERGAFLAHVALATVLGWLAGRRAHRQRRTA